MDYRDYNDYELLSLIQEEHEEAKEILFKKYEPLIQRTALQFINSLSFLGLEKNDVIQEGMLALDMAIHGYNDNKEATFYTFAKTCIERRMINLVVASKRQKHKALNESISIDGTLEDGETHTLDFLLEDEKYNPEIEIVNREQEMELIQAIKEKLTDFENEVFDLKRNEFDYKEIANLLGKEPKSIDNAIQRIKSKAKSILEQKKDNT